MFRKNLLRVLETKEFMPKGGQPLRFKHVLFVFASTNQDRERAANPPDFWTRMDVELALPDPILLQKTGKGTTSISERDAARLYSLFSQFWFSSIGMPPLDPIKAASRFKRQIFSPILTGIRDQELKEDLPVSPRRVRSFARTLSGEFCWLGSSVGKKGSEAKRAATAFGELRASLIAKFIRELHDDARNRKAIEEAQSS